MACVIVALGVETAPQMADGDNNSCCHNNDGEYGLYLHGVIIYNLVSLRSSTLFIV